MKKLLMLTMILSTLFACRKDNPISEILEEDEDYYNCSGFFDSGDYSDLCTINTPLVNLVSSTIDGNSTICSYIIPPSDYELDTETETGVSFLSLEKSDQAKIRFQSEKNFAEEHAAADSTLFYNLLTINGNDAIEFYGESANYLKSITARHKNVIVTVRVIYYPPWFDGVPCNYETEEMAQLMENVLNNM